MQRTLLGLLLSAALTVPAWAALKTGDMAPDFSTQASLAGKAFSYSLADALKKGPVVVYFYPSAFTEGCNVEAHTFSERRGEFDAAGATIIGVSLDSIDRLNDFSADPKYCAGKIAVASDADGKIAASYKLKVANAPAPGAGLARRHDQPRLCRAHDVRGDAGRKNSLHHRRCDAHGQCGCGPQERSGHRQGQGEIGFHRALRTRESRRAHRARARLCFAR